MRRATAALRITTGAQNQAMRALANKFGAHLTFRQGESTGSIDLKQQPQAELAKLAIATPADAARAMIQFNRMYWKLAVANVRLGPDGLTNGACMQQFADLRSGELLQSASCDDGAV